MKPPVKCPTCRGAGEIDLDAQSQEVLMTVANHWKLPVAALMSKTKQHYEARRDAVRGLRGLGLEHKEIARIVNRERSTITCMLRGWYEY